MLRRAALSSALTALVFAATLMPRAARASSADDLVTQAREHEAANDDAVAVRRYTEALSIDATHSAAWLGLGALRMRLGDAAEAERVYAAALERVPLLRAALRGRAEARWAVGRHTEAERDLDAYFEVTGDVPALRELAGWFGSEGRAPAALATWRRVLAVARGGGDPALEIEARRMVRALVVLVDPADPASAPAGPPDPTRRFMATVARRGG
jgi:tetratricopeptide (TPR) repeat protein